MDREPKEYPAKRRRGTGMGEEDKVAAVELDSEDGVEKRGRTTLFRMDWKSLASGIPLDEDHKHTISTYLRCSPLAPKLSAGKRGVRLKPTYEKLPLPLLFPAPLGS